MSDFKTITDTQGRDHCINMDLVRQFDFEPIDTEKGDVVVRVRFIDGNYLLISKEEYDLMWRR